MRIKTAPDKTIWPTIKNINFLEAFSLTKANTNLNRVINPQNSELNLVAYCLVETLLSTE